MGFVLRKSFFLCHLKVLRLSCKWGDSIYSHALQKLSLCIWDLCLYFAQLFWFLLFCISAASNLSLLSRQIKRHCAEPFTEYWTCIDYSGLQLFRQCRKQQAKFDDCVLDKLGWVRPDLGELSKVKGLLLGPIPTWVWGKAGGAQRVVSVGIDMMQEV